MSHPTDTTMRTDTTVKPGSPGTGKKSRLRRAVVASSVVSGLLLSCLAALPTVVMNSSWRDVMLNRAAAKHGLTVRSEAGSGGWLTPIRIRGIEVLDELGHLQTTVQEIQISKSLLSLLWNRRDLGTVTVIRPTLRIHLDEHGRLPLKRPNGSEAEAAGKDDGKRRPFPVEKLAFEVRDSAFRLSVPWRPLPIVELSDIDVSGNIAQTDNGAELVVQPIELLNHERLTPADTEQNLALIAPILSKAATLEGEVSVFVSETRIRLESDEKIPVSMHGIARFHRVNARLKEDLATQLRQIVPPLNSVESNRLDLDIVRDSQVQFHVDSSGIHHEGLAFVLPQITGTTRIESSGVVRLDESIDLTMRLQLPQPAAGGEFLKVLANLVREPLTIFVRGTVSEPRLEMPPGFSVMDDLAQRMSPGQQSEQAKGVPGAVVDLIESVSPGNPRTAEAIPGSILGLIRSIRDARQKASAEAQQHDAAAGPQSEPPASPPDAKKPPRNRRRRRPVSN